MSRFTCLIVTIAVAGIALLPAVSLGGSWTETGFSPRSRDGAQPPSGIVITGEDDDAPSTTNQGEDDDAPSSVGETEIMPFGTLATRSGRCADVSVASRWGRMVSNWRPLWDRVRRDMGMQWFSFLHVRSRSGRG